MEKEDIRNDAFFNLFEIVRTRKIQIAIGFLTVFIITVIGVIFLIPPVYEASTKIYINIPIVPKGDIPYLEDLRDVRSFVFNQQEIASSRFIYEKVVKELNPNEIEEAPSILRRFKNIFFKKNKKKPDSLEEAISDLYKNTEVRLLRETNILNITAFSSSAQGAADIANTLAKTYTNYANSIMLNKVQTAFDVISGQLKSVSNTLSKSQNALSGLKGGENLIEDRITTQNKLADYRTQYQEIQEKIQQAEKPLSQESAGMRKGKSEEIYQIQPNDSPRVKEIKTRLINLKKELDAALNSFTEKHPKVINLRGDIESLEEELSQEGKSFSVGSDINDLKRKKDYLSKQIQTLESRLLKLSNIESESAKLNRDVTTQEAEYLTIKEKFETARILKEQLQEGTIKVIDAASPPPFPSNKKKVMLLAVGFIASIVFGLGAGFIAEYLDDSFRSPEDVEKHLNLPVLATIPRMAKKEKKSRIKRSSMNRES